MRHLPLLVRLLICLAVLAGIGSSACAQVQLPSSPAAAQSEDYKHTAMPPGFQVLINALEGPVYADSNGKTLYQWPLRTSRNAPAGEQKGAPTCDANRYTENAGLLTRFPGGFLLPEVDTRPSCTQMWPPVLAPKDAVPVGSWTIVKRPDGTGQWAYEGYALYTSALDREAGDVFGATKRHVQGEGGSFRIPIGPMPNVPPGFAVALTPTGRMITTSERSAVYFSDRDEADKSNCDFACARIWIPIIAPEFAQRIGEWSVFERSPGIKQWAFRGKPLYRYSLELPGSAAGMEGSDLPGWHNAYTQMLPTPPKAFFKAQDTPMGEVLADSRGHTIYIYKCIDDAPDQLVCDHPDTPQAYRIAICGGGNAARCVETFPYVLAPKDTKTDNRIWNAMDIDPQTGHRAAAGQAGALHVWAYRDRPIYTFAGDKQPGDIYADSWGEFGGSLNGFKALLLRDDYLGNAS